MPTNVYFNNFNSRPEKSLYEDLINECIKIWGIDAYYVIRSSDSASVDLIFGDDPTKKFEQAYPVEVYVKNVDNFEGQELFSKFGLEIQHQIRFLVATRAFSKNIPSQYERPREGDLLWLSNFKALFEIKHVNQEHFFYAFGNKNFYGHELVCERFRYSNEKVDTGIIDIDKAADRESFAYNFNMVSNGVGTYEIGEQVYQGGSLETATAKATVSSWDLPTSVLKLNQIYGVFTKGLPIIGNNSNANYALFNYDAINNANDRLDNNSDLGIEASQILDFTENNPFGEPTQIEPPSDYTNFIDIFNEETTFSNDSGNSVNFNIGKKAPEDVI